MVGNCARRQKLEIVETAPTGTMLNRDKFARSLSRGQTITDSSLKSKLPVLARSIGIDVGLSLKMPPSLPRPVLASIARRFFVSTRIASTVLPSRHFTTTQRNAADKKSGDDATPSTDDVNSALSDISPTASSSRTRPNRPRFRTDSSRPRDQRFRSAGRGGEGDGPIPVSRLPVRSTIHGVPIPPESPSFLPIPMASQSSERRWTATKGVLPVPRDVFKANTRKDLDAKVRPGWIERTAAAPVDDESFHPPPTTDEEAYKLLVSAARRDALADSVRALWRRRERVVTRRAARSRETREANRAKAMAEEDPLSVEALVGNPGGVSAALLAKGAGDVGPDPARAVKAERAAENTKAVLESHKERRKEALVRLYALAMSGAGDAATSPSLGAETGAEAGDGRASWIVDEATLRERVDHLFSEMYLTNQHQAHQQPSAGYAGTNGFGAVNAWEAWGRPPTLHDLARGAELAGGANAEMVLGWTGGAARVGGGLAAGGVGVGASGGVLTREDADRAARRQQIVAEELTGGKMAEK